MQLLSGGSLTASRITCEIRTCVVVHHLCSLTHFSVVFMHKGLSPTVDLIINIQMVVVMLYVWLYVMASNSETDADPDTRVLTQL